MIEGSAVRPYLTDVWACEFIEAHHPPGFDRPEQRQLFPTAEITALGYQIDNTSKTRALFEINKGTNKHPEIHVNSHLPAALRRVPFEHMIYVADGPSDVPAWSVVRHNGGRALGVYQRGSIAQFDQINTLLRDGRIHAFAEADYRPQSTAYLWLTTEVRRIAERIVEDRELALRRAVRTAPTHVADELPVSQAAAAVDVPAPGRSAADDLRDRIRASLDASDGEPDRSAVPLEDRSRP
jgi:hypothetical protein